mmetsp:Transcript_74957/g.194924  ORF Transcript_74957/g.194924 Transcript_74957/m.194924 type:complete len:238 (-) Transcript_74957:143-856(-)
MAASRTEAVLAARALNRLLGLFESVHHFVHDGHRVGHLAAASHICTNLLIDRKTLTAHVTREAEHSVQTIQDAVALVAVQCFLHAARQNAAEDHTDRCEGRVRAEEGEDATRPEGTDVGCVVVLGGDDGQAEGDVETRVWILEALEKPFPLNDRDTAHLRKPRGCLDDPLVVEGRVDEHDDARENKPNEVVVCARRWHTWKAHVHCGYTLANIHAPTDPCTFAVAPERPVPLGALGA